MLVQASPAQSGSAHVVVLGNEKGGSGKSTTAFHVAIALLKAGQRVATIDLDARQKSLTHYVENRAAWARRTGLMLELPHHIHIALGASMSIGENEVAEFEQFSKAINAVERAFDFVIIDTPGTDNYLMRLAHSMADTLITPINDSYVDFSMLGTVDPENRSVISPSIYSEMVWEARKQRFMRDKGRFDWIVMRNRIGAADARNKRDVGASLDELARRIGFRSVKGFGERVIFRELYLQGLTLMDLKEVSGGSLSISQVAARQEVRALMAAIRLPARAQAAPAAALAPA